MSTGMWIADRRVYLDAGGKVVEEGDAARVELLVPVGGSIPMAKAQELGLVGMPTPKKGAVVTEDMVNNDQLVAALTQKDEEIRTLKAEIETFKAAKPEEPKPEETPATKAEDPDKDKAVKPVADKAVVPDKNK